MRKAMVGLQGCDDSTYFELEVTEQEFEFLKMLERKSAEVSTYGCMPRLVVDQEAR